MKRRKRRCQYCHTQFFPDVRSWCSTRKKYRQRVCAERGCQRRRHRESDRRWHEKNPTYDDGREEYVRRWRREHPKNSTVYRKAHPAYEERNRQAQKRRDRRRRNLGKQDSISRIHEGKLARIGRLIDLGKQDAIRTPGTRISEEIRRYLRWSYHLGKQDAMVVQKKIAQNRGHEKPIT